MIKNLKLKIKNYPRVAIYYDWLNYEYGGAEKVLLNILKIFPKAQLFTLFHDPKKTSWLPKNIKINTSFLQNLPHTKFLSPIYDIAAESLNFQDYDLVISTTSNVGHCLLTNPECLFICYYHNLNRHLYLHPPQYLIPILNLYQKIDKIYSKRPDFAICNSTTTQKRLSKYLNINSKLINPGINSKQFTSIPKPTNDYFLIVSRLVPHKRIDYVIDTFLSLNYQLIIVGTGRDQNKLISQAQNSSNIKFVSHANNHQLLHYYQNCTALICPQIEDFGLTALEAQSCGRPIIAFNQGGVTETVIKNKTGIFFNYQNKTSLTKALDKFKDKKFDNVFIRKHTINFDQSKFMLKFKKEIDKLWQAHLKQTKFL